MTVWEGSTVFRRAGWDGTYWHHPLGVMAARRYGRSHVAVSWRAQRFPGSHRL